MNPDTIDQVYGGVDSGDDEEIDFSQTAVRKFIFPDGDYTCVLVDIVKDVSSNGNPMWVWSWRGEEDTHNGLFKQWTVLSEGGLWRVLANCLALDVCKEGEKVSLNQVKAKGIGKRALMSLKKENRDGKDRSNIKEIKRHPDGPGEAREKLPF
jgi:hypothetical protein